MPMMIVLYPEIMIMMIKTVDGYCDDDNDDNMILIMIILITAMITMIMKIIVITEKTAAIKKWIIMMSTCIITMIKVPKLTKKKYKAFEIADKKT